MALGADVLLEFGAKNFYCFKEWVTFDLTLSAKVPKSISQGDPFVKTLCLKGANASGKTNALKILSFMESFCTNSFNLKPDEEVLVQSFFDNGDEIEMFVRFISRGIEYQYDLSLNRTRVVSEKIWRKDKRKTIAFERKNDVVLKNSIFQSKEIKLRSNASVISTYHQYQIDEFDPIYEFFQKILANVNHFGLWSRGFHEYRQITEFYNKSPEHFKFAIELLKKFDTGIDDIEISSYENDSKEVVYFPIFTHDCLGSKKTLLYHTQSSGTKSLYNILAIYKSALNVGGVLVLDEFDINLHPNILPYLINLFESKESNPHSAQMIFTTHNNDIIDVSGKYKTYLLNKKDGVCFSYRLDEVDSEVIRNDRPILPLYKEGKIGGVPKI